VSEGAGLDTVQGEVSAALASIAVKDTVSAKSVQQVVVRPIRLRPLGKFRKQLNNQVELSTLTTIDKQILESEHKLIIESANKQGAEAEHYQLVEVDNHQVIETVEINDKIKRIVEAILFVAKKPMTIKQVQQVFPELEQPELAEIQAAISVITEEYRYRPVELKQVASGYRFQIKAELSQWVSRLFEEKPPRYSRALLETLAIIAYRQPVTRADIEDIRGVSVSSSIIQTLLEREWIRVVAHKEAPGRPGLYGTTKQFLDYFNITSLNELPALEDIKYLDEAVTVVANNAGNE